MAGRGVTGGKSEKKRRKEEGEEGEDRREGRKGDPSECGPQFLSSSDINFTVEEKGESERDDSKREKKAT